MDQLVPVFLGVTNTTDEATAKQYLELTGGDLDYAVTLYMESHPPPSATSGGAGDADAELARKLQEEAYGDVNVREADASVHRHETLVDNFGFGGSSANFDRPTDIFGSGRVGVFNQRFNDEENRYYEERFEELEDDDDDYVHDDDDDDDVADGATGMGAHIWHTSGTGSGCGAL
jgi:hypothetical protein